jgi:hypothetical protein
MSSPYVEMAWVFFAFLLHVQKNEREAQFSLSFIKEANNNVEVRRE